MSTKTPNYTGMELIEAIEILRDRKRYTNGGAE